MAQIKHRATPDASDYGRPLPFRSRNPENVTSPHVSWAPTDSTPELKSHIMRTSSRADKENVKSWLDSTSPTSVLQSNNAQHQGHTGFQFNPPTPSPICSPSPSSPLSSPRSSIVELQHVDTVSPPHITDQKSSTEANSEVTQASGKAVEALASTSARHGKDLATEAPPDSPTGSAFSLGSEGGLLALLASKLLSYKENGRGFSRYARESSGPIDEKHVMEDRSQKPPVEEITTFQSTPSLQVPANGNGLQRTSSEAVSEYSLGSAYDRSLSMEFDAMLAAAVATGIRQASVLPDQPQQPLPNIEEDAALRLGDVGVHQPDSIGSRSLVRVEDLRNVSSDDEASRLISALTVMRQGRESEDMDFHSTLSEMPLSSRSSSGRRGNIEENNYMQIVPAGTIAPVESTDASYTAANINRELSLRSLSTGSNGENSLAMVLHEHVSPSASDPGEFVLSSSSSNFDHTDNTAFVPPLLPREALEKVRRDKVYAQALAFQDAQSSKCTNRYIREETKILAWENQQKINASLHMKKVEMKLEQRKAKAIEKMENEIARAHRRAEERKASAEAIRAAKTAKVIQLANSIRKTGNSPPSKSVGSFLNLPAIP